MKIGRPSSSTPTLAHLHELLAKFSDVMLTTFDQLSPTPHVRARPMAIARLGADCSLAFLTKASSEKATDALLDGAASITMQRNGCSISLVGRCSLVQDRAIISPLFTRAHEAWFPLGLDDPDLAVLLFHTNEAEIWDSNGARGLQLVASMARALFTGSGHDRESARARSLLPLAHLRPTPN